MRQRTRLVPILEDRLEDRLVLSHGAIHQAAHVVHHHAHAAAPAAAIALNGTVEGTTPLDGSGTVSPLGAVTSSGTLRARGGEPVVYTGTITLVGDAGSITASLSGRLFGPQYPGEKVSLTYTITGGTGKFRGATGSGRAVYSPVISSPAGDFALTFGTAAPPA